MPDSIAAYVSYVANNPADYKATGFSTHAPADVYAQFIAGTNEQAFWVNDSVAGHIAGMAADSTGTITASVDTIAIARAVWNRLHSAHTTAGTFGYYLDQAISSITGLAGNGAYTVYIVALDTSATVDSTLANAWVYINNTAQTSTPYQGRTDNNGRATFNLDAGTWVRYLTIPGYAQIVDTFTVTGTATDTLRLYSDNGSMTTVAAIFHKPNSTAYDNYVMRINLKQKHEGDSLFVSVGDTILPTGLVRELTVAANNNGLAYVNLYPNALMTGDSTWYEVISVDKSGQRIIQRYNVRVPAADTTVWLHNLTRW